MILFGLSMDYHVFILSRIREEHDRGGAHARTPSADGASAPRPAIITSAAVVMVAVFAIFATLAMSTSSRWASASRRRCCIDATIVRAVLLPAAMTLLGKWNWYLPGWLEWLPGGPPDTPAPAPPATVEPVAAMTGDGNGDGGLRRGEPVGAGDRRRRDAGPPGGGLALRPRGPLPSTRGHGPSDMAAPPARRRFRRRAAAAEQA